MNFRLRWKIPNDIIRLLNRKIARVFSMIELTWHTLQILVKCYHPRKSRKLP